MERNVEIVFVSIFGFAVPCVSHTTSVTLSSVLPLLTHHFDFLVAVHLTLHLSFLTKPACLYQRLRRR
jgi:hypothetical protein